MNFEPPRASSSPLFNKSEILKFGDQIKLSNFLFAYDNLKCNLPSVLCDIISLVSSHSRNQQYNQVNVPTVRTVAAGSNSVKSKSANAWNFFNKLFLDKKLIQQSRCICVNLIKKYYIDNYIEV